MNAVGILEFVDQNVLVTPSDRATNFFVIPDQGAHVEDKVVEVERCRGPFSFLITFEQKIER